MWGDAYLPGEIGSVDAGSAAEPVIELDLGLFGAAVVGGPHCHRHWSRSQKQLAVCWCGGSSGRCSAGCGVAVVGCDDMAVAFLGVVSAQGVDADEVRGRHVDGLWPPSRTIAVPRSPCGRPPALMSRSATRRRGADQAQLPHSRRASTECLRALGPVPRSALGFVASPEPVPVSVAGKQRAVPDQVRGECCGVPHAPQRQAQLLLLPNSGKVQAEAP
jgi:hypothetical protein